jgi:hypothetical protein
MGDIFKGFQRRFAHVFFQRVVMAVYFAGLSPLWIAPLLLARHSGKNDPWLLLTILFGAGSVAFSWWFSKITAFHMVEENQSFRIAFLSTFLPVITTLSFLPLVGGVFERVLISRKANPFVVNEDK